MTPNYERTIVIHTHEDVGGGYCNCGAQRCSLPQHDGWCNHPGGWISKAELDVRRAVNYRKQLIAQPAIPPEAVSRIWDHIHWDAS